MKINLGGDRLGSGNKNDIALHNYYRSTHNLSQKWLSSMAPGVLYPFMCLPILRGDKFVIDLEAACRTIPTKGPLFGSYKMQLDVFSVPMRLYQAVLHNNPTKIGMNMKNVFFPKLSIKSARVKAGGKVENLLRGGKIGNSALVKYMGLSGLGICAAEDSFNYITRDINAIPFLAYYDIFKQYYSNKQEENAYVIGVDYIEEAGYQIDEIIINKNATYILNDANEYIITPSDPDENVGISLFIPYSMNIDSALDTITITTIDGTDPRHAFKLNASDYITIKSYYKYGNQWRINIETKAEDMAEVYGVYDKLLMEKVNEGEQDNPLKIKSFKLSNIDDMRFKLLSYNNIGHTFALANTNDAAGIWGYNSGGDGTGLPYSTLFSEDSYGFTHNQYPLNGLMLKTYQSDIFNNWLNSTYVEGEGSIAALTAVSTSGGSFTIDALNLSEKLYDMYNRILVSGGTYNDWQNAVYTEMPNFQVEEPIYLGGMSSEVVFEEIVQTAPEGTGDAKTELGTLGGRGILIKRKGGNVVVKCSEASFIIGIVSITPRIVYTQGNEFYLTELKTMDDMHKPAMDGIGFQNLIGERLGWWDTKLAGATVVSRSSIGKIPAWLEYMTAVDKAYGDFADDTEEGKNFMVLSRRYEANALGQIVDATTYVDPSKFNYAFAYTELESQNFWVQINSKVIARRLMSAKQIPNL